MAREGGPINRNRFAVARVAGLMALAVGIGLSVGAGAQASNERGEYLSRIMDCTGCHTGGALVGRPDPARYLAGSEIGFQVPDLGVFYPPNLTSDAETGLGSWSVEDIVRAVTSGLRPDGRELAPVMPWRSYGALSDADARDLAAYLKSLPAVRYQVPGPFGSAEAPTAPYLTVVVPAKE